MDFIWNCTYYSVHSENRTSPKRTWIIPTALNVSSFHLHVCCCLILMVGNCLKDFSIWLQGIFMYATNLDKFGRLLLTDNYRTNNLHNDLWEIFDNKVVSSYSVIGVKSWAEDHKKLLLVELVTHCFQYCFLNYCTCSWECSRCSMNQELGHFAW